MKLITRVQSISDVITNSSSELFINPAEVLKEFSIEGYKSGCISVRSLDWEFIHECQEDGYLWTFMCKLMNWDPNEFGFLSTRDGWILKNEAKWYDHIDENFDEVCSAISGYVIIFIEDHYNMNCWEQDREIAFKHNNVFYESHH